MTKLIINLLSLIQPRRYPPIPNLNIRGSEELHKASLPLGNLYIGRQGVGKSGSLADHRVEYSVDNPQDAMFSLDASGSFTDDFISIAASYPQNVWNDLKKRIVYIPLGDPKWVVPTPEFSLAYGTSLEDQVNRVVQNFRKLTGTMEQEATILGGGALKGILPHLLRVLTAMAYIEPDFEPLQITEAETLLSSTKLLNQAITKVSKSVPMETKDFLYSRYLNVKDHERELRSYALSEIFSTLSSPHARAQLGYHTPLWTPKEAIEKGLIVLIDGSRLINQRLLQHYLFTQAFSLIMEQINRRQPHNPQDKPVALVIDEVKSLLKIPGFAEEVGDLAPLYRSRKLQPYIVIQALSQLSPEMRENIWLYGNVICFGLSNKNDAEEFARQRCKYDPKAIKLPPRTDTQNPVSEPQLGQDRTVADWIVSLPHRSCIVTKHISEQQSDQNVYFIQRTKEIPPMPDNASLAKIKEELLRKRAIRVEYALDVVDGRIDRLNGKPRPPKI